MFYQEKIIKHHLTCKACQVVFIDPRMMPCGHSFCHECILDIKGSRDGLKCPTCRSNHHMPATGFPVNTSLADILAEQPKEVSQSQQVKELRILLNSLLDQHARLKERLKKGPEEIRMHCQALRNQVDIEIETRLEEVRQLGSELKRKIDDYEKESIQTSNMALIDIEINSTLNKASDFYSNSLDSLAQYDLDESHVADLIKETKRHAQSLTQKNRQWTKTVFKDCIFKFKKFSTPFQSTYIGTFFYEQFAWSTDSFEQVNFLPANHRKAKLVDIAFMSSNRSLIAVSETDSILEISRRQFDGSVIETSEPISFENEPILVLSTGAFNNSVFLCVSSSNNSVKKSLQIGANNLSVEPEINMVFILLDSNLQFIKHLLVSKTSNNVTTNSSSIFLYDEHKSIVSVYSSNFDESFWTFEDRVPKSCEILRANDESLFICCKSWSFKIFNIKQRCLNREIYLYDCHIQLVVTNQSFTWFNNRDNHIKVYRSGHTNDNEEPSCYKLHADIKRGLRATNAGSESFILFESDGNVIFLPN